MAHPARASKLRPAVVLAEAGRCDWILCQISHFCIFIFFV
jgi:hypothetical protein